MLGTCLGSIESVLAGSGPEGSTQSPSLPSSGCLCLLPSLGLSFSLVRRDDSQYFLAKLGNKGKCLFGDEKLLIPLGQVQKNLFAD